MYIIAGLGNPEKKYDNTRHNAGFDVIDVLSVKYGIAVDTKKHKALIGKGVIEGERVLLMKPQTYMNLSGEAIREASDYYDVPPENVIVICDDIYVELGSLRVRKNGSAGGHNGLKNIILHLGSQEFKRVRVGVGPQPEKMDLVAFVLSHFTKEERENLDKVDEDAAKACVSLMTDTVERTMNLYNGKRI